MPPKWPADHEEKHREAALKGWEGRRGPFRRNRALRGARANERETPAPETDKPKYSKKQQELYDRALHYYRRADAANRGEDNPYGTYSHRIFYDEASEAQRKLHRLNKSASDELVRERLKG